MSIWDLLGEGRVPRVYQPGQLIYLQGAYPDCFYYLQDGAARSYISLPDGEERVITIHRTGDLMGEASFFDQCPRVTSAMAIKTCRVFSVSQSQLDDVFSRHPELAQPMLQYLSRTVRILSHHVNDSALPAEQRIVRWLLSQSAGVGDAIACTHEEIGQVVGASRVTVSRVISSLVKMDVMETGYRFLRIKNLEKLKQLEKY